MENNTIENWINIPNWNSYMVSNIGNIKSLHAGHRYGKVLRPDKSGDYYRVTLYENDVKKRMTVHALVALAFHPNPENKPEVNHKDGNKLNNNADNLEWATRAENIEHMIKMGLNTPTIGSRNGMCILNKTQVLEIFNSKKTCDQLSEIYSISRGTAWSIKSGKNWGHLTQKVYDKQTLSEHSILEIFNSKLSNQKLSSLYNVSKTCISNIKTGFTHSKITKKKYQPVGESAFKTAEI